MIEEGAGLLAELLLLFPKVPSEDGLDNLGLPWPLSSELRKTAFREAVCEPSEHEAEDQRVLQVEPRLYRAPDLMPSSDRFEGRRIALLELAADAIHELLALERLIQTDLGYLQQEERRPVFRNSEGTVRTARAYSVLYNRSHEEAVALADEVRQRLLGFDPDQAWSGATMQDVQDEIAEAERLEARAAHMRAQAAVHPGTGGSVEALADSIHQSAIEDLVARAARHRTRAARFKAAMGLELPGC